MPIRWTREIILAISGIWLMVLFCTAVSGTTNCSASFSHSAAFCATTNIRAVTGSTIQREMKRTISPADQPGYCGRRDLFAVVRNGGHSDDQCPGNRLGKRQYQPDDQGGSDDGGKGGDNTCIYFRFHDVPIRAVSERVDSCRLLLPRSPRAFTLAFDLFAGLFPFCGVVFHYCIDLRPQQNDECTDEKP